MVHPLIFVFTLVLVWRLKRKRKREKERERERDPDLFSVFLTLSSGNKPPFMILSPPRSKLQKRVFL